jgi:two-component system, NtrC family, nitrogen regulation response regulator NtrX
MSAARILVVDDESDIRTLLRDILTEEGYEVEVAADAASARAARRGSAFDLVLLDIWMPDTDGITLLREWLSVRGEQCPVVMMSGHGTVETAVEATRLGAFDFIEKPLSLAKLLRTVGQALEAGRQRRTLGRATTAPPVVTVGKSRLTQQLRTELQRVAPHAAALLLVGEPGSGRESLARYAHDSGPRAGQPFITLVASAIDEADADATLLGTEEGGSVRPGLLGQAQGGTLFISGLEDLSARAQRLLLGVIETGSYRRVGSDAVQPFNARIISTVQPGIESRAGQDGLRRDLLAHLNTLVIRVPPLREYAEDVPELLRYHVDRLVESERLPFRRFGVAAQNRLRNYPWPDNLRELRGLVRRMLLKGGPEEIRLEDIEQELAAHAPQDEPLVKQDLLALPLREAREQFERAYLSQQLSLCNGKVGQLAKRVGMERTHLYRKLRSLGVDFRHGAED